MTAHLMAHDAERRRAMTDRLVRLGWSDFWLLGGILGGMLALVALVYLIAVSAH